MTASQNHVVSGLIEKRRELAGIVDHLQRQIDQYRVDLAHIDGALRLLAEGLDPATLRPKRHYKRADYFGHNELSRLVLDTLRTSDGEPIGIEEIAQRIAVAKGFDPADTNLRAGIRQRIRVVINAAAQARCDRGRQRGARQQMEVG
jgi:hypothetical protein